MDKSKLTLDDFDFGQVWFDPEERTERTLIGFVPRETSNLTFYTADEPEHRQVQTFSIGEVDGWFLVSPYEPSREEVEAALEKYKEYDELDSIFKITGFARMRKALIAAAEARGERTCIK